MSQESVDSGIENMIRDKNIEVRARDFMLCLGNGDGSELASYERDTPDEDDKDDFVEELINWKFLNSVVDRDIQQETLKMMGNHGEFYNCPNCKTLWVSEKESIQCCGVRNFVDEENGLK